MIATAFSSELFLSTLSLRRATHVQGWKNTQMFLFLSTLSLRRATARCQFWGLSNSISIHALLAESDARCQFWGLSNSISIHALLAESDNGTKKFKMPVPAYFYPRSPCGERPVTRVARTPTTVISIHALLAESDGGALSSCFAKITFLSTLSLRRATLTIMLYGSNVLIFLSTLSLRRATRFCRPGFYSPGNFYPRSPCGERHSLRQL